MTSFTKKTTADNRNGWAWGFTPQAEIWNGRLAMIGFAAVLLTQYLARQGLIHFYNLLHAIMVATLKMQ